MSVTSKPLPRNRFQGDAYQFVFEALHYTQGKLDRPAATEREDESAHITGPELLNGIRELALKRYGLMAQSLFNHWGVRSTGDFGRIVFELIEKGEMRKTERDQLSDFFNVYDFDEALNKDYVVDISGAFPA